MCSNRNLISHSAGSVGHCLSQFPGVRLLTLVLLIVIEHVWHIGCHHLPDGEPSFSTDALHVPTDTHRLAKRMENLEACLGQFDVHNNTIIRTGESQAIGGKYLQGLELDTIEQCQRLCCETESCDVYIFEDKNGGYCYLFECGPPENFHCKFTRHANYTSAVLTPVRRYVEVTTTRPPPPSLPHLSTANLSQQEWELTSLKVKPETRDKLAELSAGITSAGNGGNAAANSDFGNGMQQQQQQLEIGFPQKAFVNSSAAQHCGRFQFACHSGECIAVYNACDGIPQCEDGSDEGPECSGASSNNGVVSNAKPSLETSNNNAITVENTGQKYHSSAVQQTPQQQLQAIQQHQNSQNLNTAGVNNREDAGAWANRKIVSDTEAMNSADLNSHIFAHKNGLQLPRGAGGIESIGGGSSNTGSLDMNVGVGNYPNSNANLSPLYAATLQRSGVYLPQPVGAQQSDGIYSVPQQQLLEQQGHVYMPGNLNWPQQQQQQPQHQPQQFPVVVTPLSAANERNTQLAQGSQYVMNTPQQAMTHFSSQSQAQSPHQTSTQTKGPFQPPAVANMMQAPQQTQSDSQKAAVLVTQGQMDSNSNKGSTKKVLGAGETAPAADDNVNYEDYDDQSTEPPRKKTRKHKKVKAKPSKELPNIVKNDLADDPVQQSLAQRKQQQQQINSQQPPSPVHEQYKMIHENLVMEFRDHDGQSDRPGGAVLSLTLGLLVTAALAILIGCRMRTVSRRARRLGGKAPYSHEADFLVNGMYL